MDYIIELAVPLTDELITCTWRSLAYPTLDSTTAAVLHNLGGDVRPEDLGPPPAPPSSS